MLLTGLRVRLLIKAKELGDRLDGVLLALHGAMVTDFSQDGEGELLERLRQVLPCGIPIAVTLDPHANVTAKMCEQADILISFKTYPHIDLCETAHYAGELLQQTMAEKIAPKTLLVRARCWKRRMPVAQIWGLSQCGYCGSRPDGSGDL